MQVDFVIPVYNERDTLETLTTGILEHVAPHTARIIFVDDGSNDGSFEVLRALAEAHPEVEVVRFRRNFGKAAGLAAGFARASGEVVFTMDADLQDPPGLLYEMFNAVTSGGYDAAATRRTNRTGEPPIRSFFARQYYKLIRMISKTEFVDGARDFRLFSRKVADAILQLPEYNRFTKGINEWVGFKTHWIEYENVQRAAGNTKWSFWSLFLYSLEGITAFSTVPLAFSALMGIFFCFVALFFVCFIIFRTLMYGDPVSGWPSLAVIILFTSGIQMFCLGILGQYLAKTYLETKRRPQYLIKETEAIK